MEVTDAVQIRKRCVSYHLMPLYVCPALLTDLSAGLKQRLHGKACFNFTSLTGETTVDLARRTQRGFDAYGAAGLLPLHRHRLLLCREEQEGRQAIHRPAHGRRERYPGG